MFVAGGDGTLNEVLNGLAQVDGALGAVTLAVVPLGTGNDFATAIGVPEYRRKARLTRCSGAPSCPSTSAGSTIAAS